MSEIEKPKIKILDHYCSLYNEGFNDACSAWKKYHIQEINKRDKSLMTVDEIKEIINSIDYDNFGKQEMTHGKLAELQAKAIREEMERRIRK